mgnify:CR=1 FL=1
MRQLPQFGERNHVVGMVKGRRLQSDLGDLFAEGAVTGVWAERRDDDDDRWVVLLVADRDKVDLDGQKAARVVAAFAP